MKVLKLFLFIIFVSLLASCNDSKGDRSFCYVPFQKEYGIPIISYYVDRHIENPDLFHLKASVIVAIWEDGTIIWSKKELGGAPYYKSVLTSKEVSSFLDYIKNGQFLKDPTCYEQHFSFHDDIPTLTILADEDCIYMRNSHVIKERNDPDRIGTSIGVISKESNSQAEIDKYRTEGYLRFRKNWDNIVNFLISNIPDEGEVIEDIIFTEKKIYLAQ